MLKIESLYKKQKNNVINDLSINLKKGSSISIECSNEMSDLLVDLVLGKQLQMKGEIYLEDIKNLEYVKNGSTNIGIIPREDAFYERSTVEEYLKFFDSILCSKVDYRDIMIKFELLDIANVKIKKLNYSQRRMVSFARERLKQPKLLIFQEPILNMDREGTKIIVENIEELRSNGTAVLITSVLFKDTLMLGEKAYRLNDEGLLQLDNNIGQLNKDGGKIEEKKPTYEIEKIAAKLDERILLFDPKEIDYIESEQGISNLFIRGDKFPCNLSLTNLEERLKYFGFFRCHRSYLVNLQKVREVITWTRNSYSLSLDDKVKSSIPLAKGRLEELRAILKL